MNDIYKIREEWIRRAKSNRFHLFRKRYLRKLWESNTALRVQVLKDFWQSGLIKSEIYFKLIEDIMENINNEQ